jgi:hypothetical protein
MKKIEPPFVRSPYNYDANEASDKSGLDTGTEGGAKQSFKEECDINTIVKRFGIGYEMPDNVRAPEYGDFTGVDSFHAMVNTVAHTREQFELLPAHIRAFHNNDPVKYVEYSLDPKNRAQLKEWGLLSKEALERDRIAQERLEQENEAKALAKAQERAKTQQDKTKT